MADARGVGPSVVGSGCGFGLAGSGFGLVAGVVWHAAELGGLSPEQQAGQLGTASYEYIFPAIPIGFVLGVVAGVEYARWGQRRATRGG